MQIPTWLTGRKAKLMYAVILTAILGVYSGQQNWNAAIIQIISAFIAHILGIAVEDAGMKAGTK